MILELSLISVLNRMLRSLYTSENTSRSNGFPMGTPPRPV